MYSKVKYGVYGECIYCCKSSWYCLKPFKGHVAWISEKQRLPVKTSAKANFYGEKLHRVRFYDWRERNYVIDVHIDVNLDGRVEFAAARPSIVRKKVVAPLLKIEATCPLKLDRVVLDFVRSSFDPSKLRL